MYLSAIRSFARNVLNLNSKRTYNRNILKFVPIPNAFLSKALFSSKDLTPAIPISKTSLLEKVDIKEDEKVSSEHSWNSVKKTLMLFAITFTGLGSYLVFELGKPVLAEDGSVLKDEFSDLPILQQYLLRTIKELDYYKRLIKEPSRDKLLPDVMKYPYYQPPYTLVLEMTDVLVHPDWTYKTGWRFKKRPGIDQFLENLHGLYEIVIFTAEQGMTVFPIVEALDPKNIIAYKLVRDATHFVDGVHVKNLSKLNRDLSKVIVVDWNLDAVKFHRENVFHLERWDGNDEDSTLSDLTEFLKTIAQTGIEDVRDVLNYYNKFDDPLATFRLKQQELMEKLESEGPKFTNLKFKKS